MLDPEVRCQAVLIGLLHTNGIYHLRKKGCSQGVAPSKLQRRRPIKTAWHRPSELTINSLAPALVRKDVFCEVHAKGRKILEQRIFPTLPTINHWVGTS
jgi:hypothetical protein